MVEIPSSVKEISNNALMFAVAGEDSAQHNEQRIRLHFAAGIDQVVQGLDIGFTNCEFTFGDDKMIYHLSDDGTQILDEANEVVETLETKYPVTDFDIRVVGVDSEDVLSVALDSFTDGIGSYQFEAYNFMSGDKPFASNTSVTWEIASSTSNGASITQDGLLTFTKPGEIVVKATSDENPEITATFTVRIGGVINTSGIEFTGIDGNLEPLDAITSKVIVVNGQPAVINYAVTVGTNFEIDAIDKSYTVTSSTENAVVNQDGTISVNGAGNFTITLTFNSYPDIVVTHNFIVEEKLQSFECIEQELPNVGQYLYKVGNLNSFDVTKLWQFTGLHEAEGLTESDITIGYNIINAKDNQSIDSTWYTLEGNMLQFIDFQGVVRIEITATADGVELNQIVVPLEVLDGYNVTTETELFNTTNNSYNKMILNDIVLTSYRSNGTYVVNGATLYGNGYTLNGSKATHPSTMTWYALISVQDAVIDNINVIGKIFPEITWSNGAYSAYTVYLSDNGDDQSDTCEVYNSYFYGSRASICVQAISYIYNTVFEGGVLANIVVENDVTLNDVTTIQNTASENITDEVTEDNIDQLGVGLGVFVDTTFVNKSVITISGDFRQYNWVDSSLVEKVKDPKYYAALKELLKNTEYIYQVGDVKYVNAGIVFMGELTDNSTIVDNRDQTIKDAFPYTSKNLSAFGFTGAICSLTNKGNQITAGDSLVTTEYDRLDSNNFERNLKSLQTIPAVFLDNTDIDAKYGATINGNTLSVNIGSNGTETFVISNSNLPVKVMYYGSELVANLVTENGDNLDSLVIDPASSRYVTLYIKVSVSNWYDNDGILQGTTATHYYEFIINSKLDYDDATWNEDTFSPSAGKNNQYFYVSFSAPTWDDWFKQNYYLAAHILDGLKITDYDPVTKQYKETDYSNYTQLPSNITIKSISVGITGGTSGELKVYNSKLLFVSDKASPDKRSETLKIVLTYVGYNGVPIDIELRYGFTSSTESIRERDL